MIEVLALALWLLVTASEVAYFVWAARLPPITDASQLSAIRRVGVLAGLALPVQTLLYVASFVALCLVDGPTTLFWLLATLSLVGFGALVWFANRLELVIEGAALEADYRQLSKTSFLVVPTHRVRRFEGGELQLSASTTGRLSAPDGGSIGGTNHSLGA